MLKRQLSSFLRETSLHGFNYITDKDRSKCEKWFWSMTLLISGILTAGFIYKLVLVIRSNPIVMVTDVSPIPITDILFPSLSICPSLIFKINHLDTIDYNTIVTALENGERNIKNLTIKELKFMQVISLISKDGFLSEFNVSVPTDDFIETLQQFPTVWRLKKAPDDLFDVGIQGNWSNRYTANFTMTLGPTGICATFNFPNASQFFNLNKISVDFNYSDVLVTTKGYFEASDALNEYPVKGSKTGDGLFARINKAQWRKDKEVSVYDNAHAFEVIDGFFIILHHPFESPSETSFNIHTRIKETMNFFITPKLTDIDESLISFSPKERSCYRGGEKRLKFYKFYSKNNCEHECLASKMLEQCDCVQFFMARDTSTRICGVADEKCFRPIEQSFQKTKITCKCLKRCDTLTYDIQAVINQEYGYVQYLASIFYVDFKVKEIFPVIRRAHELSIEKFAYIGGLLGLFAGFSLVSLVEFFYLFMIRPFLKSTDIRVQPANHVRKDSWLREHIFGYFKSSSVRSFNYVTSSNSRVMKCLWLALSLWLIVEIGITSSRLHSQYKSNKIALTLNGRLESIDKIPFPAVTFVSEFIPHFVDVQRRYAHYKYKEYLNGSVNFHKEWIEDLRSKFFGLELVVHHLLCQDYPLFELDNEFYNFTSNSEVVDFLKDMPHYQDWWKSKEVSWNTMKDPPYTKVLTRNGIGFSYNMLALESLLDFDVVTPDFNISREVSQKTTQWTASADGRSELVVDLKNNLEFYFYYGPCREDMFIIHDPNQLPDASQGVSFLYGKSYDVFISVEVILSDEDLRSISAAARKCYFEDERKLIYFKVYTKDNCEMECRSIVTFEECGCAPFHYARNKTMRVCDIPGMACAWRLLNLDYERYVHLFDSRGICNCLPTCNSVTYSLEYVPSKYNANYSEETEEETTIRFKFKESSFYPLRRYQFYTFEQIMSNAGGLMGLLAGASVLSIVEFFYFFTLRQFMNVWMFCTSRQQRRIS